MQAVPSSLPTVRVGKLLTRSLHALLAQALYRIALVWRCALRRTTFVAVTGSHGKTTTMELLAAILRSRGRTIRSTGNANSGLPLTRTLLRVRPWHRFAVIEVGVGAPDEMRRLARLVRPDVAVVLAVLHAHTRAFGDQARHAAEKAVLLDALRPGGVAVLNGDDPLVRAMAVSVRSRVLLFGGSPGLDAWAEAATACWPGRLELTVRTRDGDSCRVRTRLVGTHWSASVAAAITVARDLGVSLAAAAQALETVNPPASRLQPVLLPSGAVILRDDYDGSYPTFQAGLRVLAEARAGRRVAVISDVSDFGSARARKRLAHLGHEAAQAAELVVFFGEGAGHGREGALAAGRAADDARAFGALEDAAAFLRATLRHGDLVLLKGRTSDHAARLFFSQLGPIRCLRPQCEKRITCDACEELGIAAEDRERATVCPPGRAAP
jgi:UDP-N-acetylmuramoyl-tripeptide--D-alanyl-D-alanine ligase